MLLHGYGNHRPRGHWQWWLAEQLRRRDEQVLYPQLPDPDRPDPAAWLQVLADEYEQLGPGERIVVCHSLACALWYLAAASGTAVLARPAGRVLLVAPAGRRDLAQLGLAGFAPTPWRAHVLASSSSKRIKLVASDNDPNCSAGTAAALYGRPLGLDAETIPGAGHLTTDDGYGPWPEVLGWCLDPETRFCGGGPRRQAKTAPGQD
ncbi:MAG: RBBP9/YdeN family alpha/beta hydrolase [Candidatus Dormibacteria bacterium]